MNGKQGMFPSNFVEIEEDIDSEVPEKGENLVTLFSMIINIALSISYQESWT